MKMPASSRIYSSFVAPVAGREVLWKRMAIISICLLLLLPGKLQAGSFSEELWKLCDGDYQQILHMPFNRELSNGTLDEKIFKSYIVQDYFFLLNFRKTYGILLAKSPDAEGTKFALDSIKAIDEEIRWTPLSRQFFRKVKLHPGAFFYFLLSVSMPLEPWFIHSQLPPAAF